MHNFQFFVQNPPYITIDHSHFPAWKKFHLSGNLLAKVKSGVIFVLQLQCSLDRLISIQEF